MAVFQDVAKEFAAKQARTVYCVYFTGGRKVEYLTVAPTRSEAFKEMEIHRASINCKSPQKWFIVAGLLGLDYDLDV